MPLVTWTLVKPYAAPHPDRFILSGANVGERSQRGGHMIIMHTRLLCTALIRSRDPTRTRALLPTEINGPER
jgi:hypothetical protein